MGISRPQTPFPFDFSTTSVLPSIRNLAFVLLVFILNNCMGAPPGTLEEKAKYFCENAQEALAFGDDERSLSLYFKAVEINPRSFSGHLGVAQMQIRRRRFAEAAGSLDKARTVAGSNGGRWEALGNAYAAARDWKSAIAAHRKHHELVHESASPLLRLGDLYLSLARYELAQIAYREAARRKPDLAGIQAGLGRVYSRKGSIDSASAYLKTAHDLDPTNPDLNCELASLLIQNGKPDEAALLLEPITEVSPFHVRVRYMLARSYAALGRDSSARKQTEAFDRLRQIRKNIESLEDIVAENPTANSYSALAHLYTRVRNDSLARASHRRATVLDPLATAAEGSHTIDSY